MKRGSLSILLLLSMSFMLMDCATFKSEMEGKFDASVEKSYDAEKVSVLFIFSHYRQTKGYDAIPKLDNKFERIRGFDDFFQDALNEFSHISPYSTFTEYAADVNDNKRRAMRDSLITAHDFVMRIKFRREKIFTTHFLGTIASIASLTVIPIPYNFTYSVDIDLHGADGGLIKTYSRNAKLTKWVQMALIFIYPFHPEKRKKEELYVEFMHDIFRQIETENVLIK